MKPGLRRNVGPFPPRTYHETNETPPYIYIYIHTYIHTYIYIYIYTSVYLSIYIDIVT